MQIQIAIIINAAILPVKESPNFTIQASKFGISPNREFLEVSDLGVTLGITWRTYQKSVLLSSSMSR